MGAFDAIGVAGTGVATYRKWLDAVADNMANLNTARRTDENAFQARSIVVQPVNYGEIPGGVQVVGAAFGDPAGRLVYDPAHPLADAQGMVRYPDIDLASQMTQLLMAQRGYQANLAVVDRAREAYQAALALGRGA